VLAEELVVRLAEARCLGSTGESFPLVLDDPFIDFDSSVKPALLELLVEASHRQQVVLLTHDPDVAAWARLEAITGALSVVEPSGIAAPAKDHQAMPESTRLVI
jgi:ABC-type lipoprotein export system ATPase subunit